MVLLVLTAGSPGRMSAQYPTSNMSLGAAFAFNGSGPMGSIAVIPWRVGGEHDLQVGIGIGGYVGRLSNDTFRRGYRHLYGAGVRAELRWPAPSDPVSTFLRLGVDLARSSMNNANFIVSGPDLPGDPWDRSSGDGPSVGLEAGFAMRIGESTLLQVSGSYDRQALYHEHTNSLWRFSVGFAKSRPN